MSTLRKSSRLLLLFIAALPIGCGSTENARTLARQAAEQRFEGEVEYAPNASGTFLLCFNRPKVMPGHPLRPLRFLVFDLRRKEVVFEDDLPSADVYWLTDTRFQVHFIPEVLPADEEADGYMYDLATKTRHPFLKDQ